MLRIHKIKSLGDQMNSLTTCFLDLQYFICFYATEVDYSDWQPVVRTLNVTGDDVSSFRALLLLYFAKTLLVIQVPWGYVDVSILFIQSTL